MLRRKRAAGLALALLWGAAPAQADHWAKVGRHPLSDRAAAKLVVHTPEPALDLTRPFVRVRYFGPPSNAQANRYYVTNRDLRAFRSTRDKYHRSILQVNPWFKYVDGRTYMHRPSTQDVIMWGAKKWGVPVNWMRAIIKFESLNMQYLRGDLATVSPFVFKHSPWYTRVAPNKVYESLGIAQIKWLPDGSIHPGTQPLRWKSTAFNVDYLGATIRYFFDGKCDWCGAGYRRGQPWNSVGAWNSPIPWNNPKKTWYISRVKLALSQIH